MTQTDDRQMLTAVASAMASDQGRCRAVIAEWLEREGVTLDRREAKRFFQRVYVKHGANYRWSRLLRPAEQEWMQTALTWAQSRKGWSAK